MKTLVVLLVLATTATAAEPLFHVATGQQLMYARSSWDDPAATVVLFRCGKFNAAHHPTFDGGHFEMLRKGEWVLSRPRAYSDSGNVDGLGANNSLLLGNQPLNFTRREMLGAGETNGVYWMLQEHGGPWVHGNVRTATYVHYCKRWLVWVPGAEADVLLVRDVLDVSQPPDQRFQPSGRPDKTYNIGKAAERHAEYIESQGGPDEIPLVQWIVHSPVMPVSSSLKPLAFSWQTGGRQQVSVTTLLPVEVGIPDAMLVDETNWYGRGVDAKELGWQVRISPTGFQGGKVELLHAITISGPGDADRPAVTLEAGGKVKVGERLVEFSETGVQAEQLPDGRVRVSHDCNNPVPGPAPYPYTYRAGEVLFIPPVLPPHMEPH